MSSNSNINPEVQFEYEGEMYEGIEIGIFMENDNSESSKAIVECKEFNEPKYIPHNKIEYNLSEACEKLVDEVENDSKGVNIMSKPAYSVNENGTWVAYSINDEKVTSHDTHKKLKNRHNVESAKSPEEDTKEAEKYDYKLTYCPADLT